jgi:hypothetical protein
MPQQQVMVIAEEPGVSRSYARPLEEIVDRSLQPDWSAEAGVMARDAVAIQNRAFCTLVDILVRKGALDLDDIKAIASRGKLVLHGIVLVTEV